MHPKPSNTSANFDKERRFLALLDEINRTTNQPWMLIFFLVRIKAIKAVKRDHG